MESEIEKQEEMRKRLNDAAVGGNVSTLKALVQEDPILVDKILVPSFFTSPLDVAIECGHLEFTKVLLSHKPELATDPEGWFWFYNSPLHIASAKGHVEIVRELLRLGPSSACLARNTLGQIPLHLAITTQKREGGQAEVIRELTQACPESTRLKLDDGGTIFHLCVQCDNLEALKLLAEELMGENDAFNLLGARDNHGYTLFHLAAHDRNHRKLKIIKYLLTRPGIELSAKNSHGRTALDMVGIAASDPYGQQVLNILLESVTQRACNSSSPTPDKVPTAQENDARYNIRSKAKRPKQLVTCCGKSDLDEFRDELFLVSTIIVAVIVLPIINMKINGSISGDKYTVNTLSLVPSLALMLLLLSGLPFRNKLCVWLMMQLLYTGIGLLGWTCFEAIISNEDRNVNLNGILTCIWFGLLIMVSILNVIRLVLLVMKNITRGAKERPKLHTI